jgi:hypothetical protein
MPVQAEVLSVADARGLRGDPRHQLRLPVEGSTVPACGALIHNLSRTGMLIETTDDLAVGETIQVELPHAGVLQAEVVWHSERLFGCQFHQAISKAAVSAALLRSPAPVPGPAELPPLAEAVAPQDPSPEGWDRGDVDSAGVRRLPARTRLMVIAGLSIACWAVVGIPAALIAF